MTNFLSNLKDKIYNQLFFYKKFNLNNNSIQINDVQNKEYEQFFANLALEVFRYQSEKNIVYQQWLELLGCNPNNIQNINEIPFLPIRFFKNNLIKTEQWKEEIIFKSSGTTGQIRSKHAVKSLDWYHQLAKHSFEIHFGSLKEYTLICLLPSYLENGDSSLVDMIDYFLKENDNPNAGYFLDQISQLPQYLKKIQQQSNHKIILWGVTYAITDLAYLIQQENIKFPNLTIIETGGMKGRKSELIREELHQEIKSSFGISQVYSEYGMTELLSQAYAMEKGIYQPSPTMKVLIRNPYDPLEVGTKGKGCINVIDLGNVDTCAFIGTDDIGSLHNNGHFEVLGRLDSSDIRGCSLLYE